jgi:hypothetical protein
MNGIGLKLSIMTKYSKKFRKKVKSAKICLDNLAESLDRCSKYDVKLKHGIVMSRYGYILPFGEKWVVRMLIDTGSQFNDDDDD